MGTERPEGYRLSPQQERLWRLHQDDSGPYRAECWVRVSGAVGTAALRKALKETLRRHEILRSTFRRLPGVSVPVQVVNDEPAFGLSVADLSGRSHDEADGALETLACELARERFDLERGPLLHARLVALSPTEHVLLLVLPALCADLATLEILRREIGAAWALGGDAGTVGEPMQYADFAEWQNELLEGEGRAGRDYWRQRIGALPLPSPRLPFEREGCGPGDFRPAVVERRLGRDASESVRALAERAGVSVEAVLLTAWQVVLWRLDGQSERVVGVGCDGRRHVELAGAAGLFARYVPLRVRLDATRGFRMLVATVDQGLSEARGWQDYFAWEGLGGSEPVPFIPLGFDLERRGAEWVAGDVSFATDERHTRACIDRFKVKLTCVESGDGLVVEVHYDSGLFDVDDLERLAAQYELLLRSVAGAPEVTVGGLSVVGDVERRRVLVEFNETGAGYSPDRCVHELFEAQAERVPDATAVVCEDRRLTYRELDTRANQLAHYLRRLGVGPDVPVAVCLDRSTELVVAVLGILKAGGAYVPLDPALPRERLAFMQADARTAVLLTQARLGDVAMLTGGRAVCLDRDWEVIGRESEAPVRSGAGPANLAYVIYTSGSTGRPKGVGVEHRQLAHYVGAIAKKLDVPTGASFALVSTFAADLGNTALFPSLCGGGCLHVLTQERMAAPDAFAEYMRRCRIDCVKIVPSHLGALLTAARPEEVLPRTLLVLGGEACGPGLVERIRVLAPRLRILNHYGPTEATVGVVTYRVEEDARIDPSGRLPLGRPIANTRIYLLDSCLEPVPIWGVGELYIGGRGVARGYLGRPELTAERFLPDPFGTDGGGRLYRTGDLARYRPDGTIEFLGRADQQVKIRGFRVELGEVEAVLTAHPRVREAVVRVWGEASERRLVAYVVAGDAGLTRSELRQHARDRLPDHMVPAAFVMLRALPLTPNGKVDRQGLPAPEAVGDREDGIVGPRTPTEEALAAVWRQVLGLKEVGIHDNFFELGGDSILSIQIIARASRVGIHLTPRQIFERQTIAELAAVAGASGTVDAEQGPVTGAVVLTPIQRRFFEQDHPDRHHYNQALMLEVPEGLDAGALGRAVEELLAHHDALRLRFERQGTQWRQVIAPQEESEVVSRVDLSAVPDAEQSARIEARAAELQGSLDLSRGPLVRLALFDLGRGRAGRLLWIVHHLAVDGVSWRILLEDLVAAYRQALDGRTIALPAKTTSFKRWAEQLAELARSSGVRQELAYWLAEERRRIERLPVDFADGVNTRASTRSVAVSLDEGETRTLLQDVSAAYRARINDVLLTALAQAFARWTGAPRLLVDLEGHGREDIVEGVDVSRTVGWFTSIFPAVVTLEDPSKLGEALKSVKEQLRGVPSHGVGYGLLRYLGDRPGEAARLRALPQSEVSFNYLGQLDQMFPESSPFRRARDARGPVRSVRGSRPYLLSVNGGVEDGRLRMVWTYSETIHRRETVAAVAGGFVDALRSLIAQCSSTAARGLTPSDFPAAKVSQKDLETVLTRFRGPRPSR
jgi:amino acid adenylation domain-containing protein/non-ribosomal peptide synthase protein (TIGR01720 family)